MEPLGCPAFQAGQISLAFWVKKRKSRSATIYQRSGAQTFVSCHIFHLKGWVLSTKTITVRQFIEI